MDGKSRIDPTNLAGLDANCGEDYIESFQILPDGNSLQIVTKCCKSGILSESDVIIVNSEALPPASKKDEEKLYAVKNLSAAKLACPDNRVLNRFYFAEYAKRLRIVGYCAKAKVKGTSETMLSVNAPLQEDPDGKVCKDYDFDPEYESGPFPNPDYPDILYIGKATEDSSRYTMLKGTVGPCSDTQLLGGFYIDVTTDRTRCDEKWPVYSAQYVKTCVDMDEIPKVGEAASIGDSGEAFGPTAAASPEASSGERAFITKFLLASVAVLAAVVLY
jgi:hypothetical protein